LTTLGIFEEGLEMEMCWEFANYWALIRKADFLVEVWLVASSFG
jgi:hypothetical protein